MAEHDLPLHVIVGSEIKTATGEVIGLYLTEDIPRGMPFADTVEAIRAQGAVVYVPHPFDRLHSIPDPALLRRLADQIDVLETCNARLYRDAYNREAERFAERYDLLAGAGSDAHVLEGLGSGCVELPPFDDAESLLLALARGQIVRRPVNLVYLQGLKWFRSARSRAHGRRKLASFDAEHRRDLRALPRSRDQGDEHARRRDRGLLAGAAIPRSRRCSAPAIRWPT